MTQKTTLILNAPPEAGKDTIADLLLIDLLASKVPAQKIAFKDDLYKAMADFYKLSLEYVIFICTKRIYKDTLHSTFSKELGLTPRQGIIHVSEDICKPKFGKDYFGVCAAKALKRGVNIFSDGGGWYEELIPVIKASGKLIICRMHREGYDFSKDSRSYYVTEGLPAEYKNKVVFFDLYLEDGKQEEAVNELKKVLFREGLI